MRHALPFFLLLFFSCSKSLNSSKELEKTPVNVVFIAVDDLNNWIGAMGGKAKTPNIDKLAAEGILFSNAHCVFPACNPSRTAIMTGQRPETNGQFTNAGNFREKPGGIERITLPQYLQTLGYATIGAGKVFHNPPGKGSKADPQSDPISWNYQFPNHAGTGGHASLVDQNGQAKWLDGALSPEKTGKNEISYLSKFGVWGITEECKEQTADWQNAAFSADYLFKKQEKPFFLACGIFRPHAPQIVPKEFMDMYPLEKIEVHEMPEDDLDDIPALWKENFSSDFVRLVKEKNQMKKAIQAYMASISFADACIGEILRGLDSGPNAGNTVVVLWSDHGWQLGHKYRWEKYSLWHQGTNSPLLFRSPNVKSNGQKCTQAVSLLDIFPTVLDLLGKPKPNFVEGESLVPQLKNPKEKRAVPAIITYPEGSYAVELDQWNYILYSNGDEELYDHSTDPMEFRNLAANEKYLTKKNELKRWLEDLP